MFRHAAIGEKRIVFRAKVAFFEYICIMIDSSIYFLLTFENKEPT